jgi:hypothetical protein
LNTFFVFLFHFFKFFREGSFELGVNLSETEVDNHASFGFGIVEEVSRFDIPVINAEFFEVFEANKELENIMFNVLNGKGIEESLDRERNTIKGLNLKYSKTICVISWWTNKLTNLGRFYLPLTSRRKAISA